MKFRRRKSFKSDLEHLPKEIQELIREKFNLFVENPSHPSLKIKKMQGFKDMWEGHITTDYVFTFHWDEDPETGEPIAVFRRVGTHEIYKKP